MTALYFYNFKKPKSLRLEFHRQNTWHLNVETENIIIMAAEFLQSPPRKKLRRTISEPQKADHSQNVVQNFVKRLISDYHNQNLEDCIVIWLDTNAKKKSNRSERTKASIQFITSHVKFFDKADACISYVTNIKYAKIFFIVSGEYGKIVLPVVHHLACIEFVYIYCLNKDKHIEWSKALDKVRGVFVERYLLLAQVTKDISDYIDRTPISVIQGITTQDMKNEPGKSMWFQILMHVLLRLPYSEFSKTDIVHECLKQYNGDDIEQRRIIEFKNQYKCEDAIRWYTRNCFLYRLTNKALRTENLENIFLFRFFIIDLYKQLQRLHAEQFQHNQTLILYRGQNMHAVEFEKLQNNINGYIAVNTFFSTTSSSAVASYFSGYLAVQADSTLRSIVFEINVESNINKSKPFARISEVSYNRDEDEYLFTLGTVFQILSVEQYTEEIWYITLTMVSEENEPLKNISDEYKASVGENASLLVLGEILALDLDNYKMARQCYELLIRELPEDDINIGYAYSRMAVMMVGEENFEEAQSLFKKAKQIYSTVITEHTQYYLSEFYIDLATLRHKQNRHKAALKLKRKALRIRKSICSSDSIALANTYKSLGHAYHELEQVSVAIKYYKKSDEINQQKLPSNHPEIVHTWMDLADAYNDEGNYNKSIEYHEKSLNILLECMPADHLHIASCYFSLGNLLFNMDEHQRSLENLEKGLEITLKSRAENDPGLVPVYTHIGSTYKKMNYPKTAFQYYKKALSIIDEQSEPDLNNLLETYCHLLYFYYDQEKFLQTIKYCRKILRLRESCEYKLSDFFAQAYDILGCVYCIQNKGQAGMKYCKKALRIRKSIYPENHPKIADTYHNMACAFATLKKHNQQLKYALEAIRIRLNPSTDFRNKHEIIDTYGVVSDAYIAIGNHLSAIETLTDAKQYMHEEDQLVNNYMTIGNIYYDYIENYETAKNYYEKALTICKEASLEKYLAETYWNIGRSYQYMDNGSLAIEHFKFALSYGYVADNSQDILTEIHHSIGNYYQATERFPKAIKHYHKALSYGMKDECLLEELYFNMASAYVHVDAYAKAMIFYRRVVRIYRSHAKKCQVPDYAAQSYIKMGFLASTVFKKVLLLIRYTKKALSIYKHMDSLAINNKEHRFIAHNNLGDAYFRLNKYRLASKHLEIARTLAADLGISDEHPQMIEIQSQIATIKDFMTAV